jgi:hypothetical protein
MLDKEHVKEFMEKRVSHVYGSLKSRLGYPPDFTNMFSGMDFTNSDIARQHYGPVRSALDYAYDASQHIRVISQTEKELDKETIDAAQQHLEQAKVVYILGFGFDPLNCKRLDLYRLLAASTSQRPFFGRTRMTATGSIRKPRGS